MSKTKQGGTRKIWSWGFRLLKLVVVVVLMTWVITNADTTIVFAVIREVNPQLILLAIAMQILGAAIMAVRWSYLLKVRNIEPGFRYLFSATVSAFFFRQFMPSVVGGDAIRSIAAWRAGADPGFAALTLVADRLFGLLALILFLAVASIFMTQFVIDIRHLWVAIGVCAVFVCGGLVFLLAPGQINLPSWMPPKCHQIMAALRVLSGTPSLVPGCIALSVVLQINVVTFYWVIGHAVGLDLPYYVYYAIVPISLFAMMAPFSINGIGIREITFIYLLGLFQTSKEVALAFAWLEYSAILIAGLIGGVVYLLQGRVSKPDTSAEGRKEIPNAT